MKRLIACAIVLLLGFSAVQAATIYAIIETDQASYEPEDTVTWTIHAWGSQGDNRGVSLLALTVHEDQGQIFQAADTSGVGVFYQLADSDFNPFNGFILESPGVPEPLGGALSDIDLRQSQSRILDQGLDDGVPPLPLFAHGSFVLADNAVGGTHNLWLEVRGANYWPDAIENAVAFEFISLTDTSFEVVPEPVTLLLTGVGLGCLGLIRRRRS